MSEHLSDQSLERYRQRVMPPAELLAANDHLIICEACYQRFNNEDQLAAAYTFIRADLQESDRTEFDHLVYEQMVAYVDHVMSRKEAEILESHIELCQSCDADVRDLRDLKAALYADEKPAPKTPTLGDRFSAFWRAPVYRIVFQVASTTVLVALFVWLATSSLRTRVADLQTQLTDLRQENEQLQQEYRTAEMVIAELKAALAPSSPQPIMFALNDGDGQVTLDKQGNLGGLNFLSPSYQQMVKTALTTQRVASSPVIARLTGNPKNLMGDSGDGVSFKLLSPVGTVVQTDRPTFRWTALSEATGYIVTIYKPHSEEVATSPVLSTTEWRALRPLRRGGIYAWQVRAMKDGEEIRMPVPTAPDVKFKILEQVKADELERAKQLYANSHLMLGLLYAQAGLLDNAEQEFQTLSEANPQSRVAQNLLHSVKAMRRT